MPRTCRDCDRDCGGDLEAPSRRGFIFWRCCWKGGGGTSSGDEFDRSNGEFGLSPMPPKVAAAGLCPEGAAMAQSRILRLITYGKLN